MVPMTDNFEDVLRQMLAMPPKPQQTMKKSEMLKDLKEETFKTGDRVPHSGIYLATHATGHTKPHKVTCTAGSDFPECNECGSVTFTLYQAAQRADANKFFKEEK